MIDSVLGGLSFLFVYLDDILVDSSSAGEHLLHLRQLFREVAQSDGWPDCEPGKESVLGCLPLTFWEAISLSRGLFPC